MVIWPLSSLNRFRGKSSLSKVDEATRFNALFDVDAQTDISDGYWEAGRPGILSGWFSLMFS